MTRPNVLFIISDQHNAKVLGHKDHPDVFDVFYGKQISNLYHV